MELICVRKNWLQTRCADSLAKTKATRQHADEGTAEVGLKKTKCTVCGMMKKMMDGVTDKNAAN